jgi:ribosomal protein S18 acetylase RimI-like enzyme
MSDRLLTFRAEPRREDVELVRALVRSTGFFNRVEEDVAVELLDDRLARGAAPSGYHFLFAERGGHCVGYACYGPVPLTRHSWDLYWIVVDGAARNRGIGKALLRRVEEHVAAEDGHAVYIETSARAQYEPTRAFYLSSGYHIEHVFADFYAPGDDKSVYVKRLAPAG